MAADVHADPPPCQRIRGKTAHGATHLHPLACLTGSALKGALTRRGASSRSGGITDRPMSSWSTLPSNDQSDPESSELVGRRTTGTIGAGGSSTSTPGEARVEDGGRCWSLRIKLSTRWNRVPPGTGSWAGTRGVVRRHMEAYAKHKHKHKHSTVHCTKRLGASAAALGVPAAALSRRMSLKASNPWS